MWAILWLALMVGIGIAAVLSKSGREEWKKWKLSTVFWLWWF